MEYLIDEDEPLDLGYIPTSPKSPVFPTEDFQHSTTTTLDQQQTTSPPCSNVPCKRVEKPKSKRGKRGKKTKNNLSATSTINKEKKKKKTKKYKQVKNTPELFHIKKVADLPYSCEHCLVGTKLPKGFDEHLRSPKHISTIALKKVSADCLFCSKSFSSVHNFKLHLPGSAHHKNLNKFIV